MSLFTRLSIAATISFILLPIASEIGLPTTAQQAIAQEISVEDQKAEGDRLFREAEQLYVLGEYQEALEILLQASTIYQSIDDPLQQASIERELGNIYLRLGEYQNALTFHYQALKMFRKMNDYRQESIALMTLGFDYFALGDYPLSINFQKQALVIAKEIEDFQLQGDIFRYLGNIYTLTGRLQQAVASGRIQGIG